MNFIEAYRYSSRLRAKIEQSLISYTAPNKEKPNGSKPNVFLLVSGLRSYIRILTKLYLSNNDKIFFLNELYSTGSKDFYLYNSLLRNNDLVIGYTKEDINENSYVYSIGSLNKLVVKISFGRLNAHLVWMLLLYPILRKFKKDVFIHSYSNDLGLAVLGLRNVCEFFLSEIQHTTVKNYPPYKLSGVKGIDAFYYWEKDDMEFLVDKGWASTKVNFIELPKISYSLQKGQVYELFYIVTGDGPLLPEELFAYLNHSIDFIRVKIFNHPRRKVTQEYLERNLGAFEAGFVEIVELQKWFELIHDKVILLCTSSTVAVEARTFKIPIIIIGKLGKERFRSYINSGEFIYSNNLIFTLKTLV